jgi:outer membrane protein
LDKVKLALYKEIQQAWQSASAAQAKYAAAETALQAALKAYGFAEERYDAEKSTVFELSEARNRLVSAQSQRTQAKYEYLFRTRILDFYRGEMLY